MNTKDLESWAIRAAQELRELIADAEEAAPAEERYSVLLSARALVAEFDDIFNGRPLWQCRLRSMPDEENAQKDLAMFEEKSE